VEGKDDSRRTDVFLETSLPGENGFLIFGVNKVLEVLAVVA
jgi:hypothetical protein